MQSSDVDSKPKGFRSGQIIIWLGIICGNLEVVLNVIYVINTKFQNKTYAKACVTFIVLEPLWYLFVYVLFIS